MQEILLDHLSWQTEKLRRYLNLSRADLTKFNSDRIITNDYLGEYDMKEQLKLLGVEGLMTEVIRGIIIDRVADCFRDIGEKNIYLRGSSTTGLFPLDDLDVSYYGPRILYKPEDWPQDVAGIPISWGNIPSEDLPECMNTNLRMMSSLLEAYPVTEIDPLVEKTIKSADKILKSEGRDYYLLFRQFEEKRADLPWKNTNEQINEYKRRKETPGSKRTIQRICWSLKALYPEFDDTPNPSVLLVRAFYKGLVPFQVVKDAFNVLSMIKSELYNADEFFKSTKNIHEWYMNILVPKIDNRTSKSVPADYIKKINQAFDSKTDQAEFSGIIDVAENQDRNYKKWLMLWIVSHNVACPDSLLLSLWREHLGSMAYRNLLRNLLRNPSFPINRVKREETLYDPHLVQCYDSILKV